LPLPAPDDGPITERLPPELRAWHRLQLRALELVARPPTLVAQPYREAPVTSPAARLALAMERVRSASGRSCSGPPNPAATWPGSTYEYRVVDALAWAAAAGLDGDESGMAWALASEADRVDLYPQYALAIGEAIWNDAQANTGGSVHRRVTMAGVRLKGGKRPPAEGHYGRQSGRWCSSWQRPTERHVVAARAVLGAMRESSPLIGHGGRRWIDGRVMDRGFQAGKRLRHDAEGIVRAWGAEGWQWVGPILDGRGELLLDPYVLCLFRFVGRGAADIERGVEMVRDGRRRWRISPRQAG
jgi:hypothetical protein